MTASTNKVSASLGGIVLGMLCQCSLFDLSGLDNGGSDAADTDAMGDALVPDATIGPGDLDASDEVSNETGDGFDASEGDGDSGALGAPDDAEASSTTADSARDVGSAGEAGDSGSDAGDGARAQDAAGDGGDGAGVGVDSGDSGSDAPFDSGTLGMGLVAFYPFDESSGTSAADLSGGGHTATMRGATFSAGLQGNAATMNGTAQYVSLPTGIVSGLTTFSISAWIYLNNATAHTRLFDFGTGTVTYMFFTPNSAPARFAITTGSTNGEQRIDAPGLATGSWLHVAVTWTGNTGALYVSGAAVLQNTSMTLTPSSLGMTTQNWLGHSQFFPNDPDLNGKIDNFRIYNRALSAAEVQQLVMTKQ